MNIAQKLVAAAIGAATVGTLVLPVAAASASATSSASDASTAGVAHRDDDRRHHARRIVTAWTIVRADDADGREAFRLRAGQWAKVQVVRAFTDCNTEDESDACRFGRNGSAAAAGADWLAPGLRQFSLVGAVGDGDLVQLGSDRTKLTGPGTVTLAYNDLVGAYDDNRGGFLVKITKCRWGC